MIKTLTLQQRDQATQNMNVCVTDFTRLDNIVEGLLAFEVANLKGPSFRSTTLEKGRGFRVVEMLWE